MTSIGSNFVKSRYMQQQHNDNMMQREYEQRQIEEQRMQEQREVDQYYLQQQQDNENMQDQYEYENPFGKDGGAPKMNMPRNNSNSQQKQRSQTALQRSMKTQFRQQQQQQPDLQGYQRGSRNGMRSIGRGEAVTMNAMQMGQRVRPASSMAGGELRSRRLGNNSRAQEASSKERQRGWTNFNQRSVSPSLAQHSFPQSSRQTLQSQGDGRVASSAQMSSQQPDRRKWNMTQSLSNHVYQNSDDQNLRIRQHNFIQQQQNQQPANEEAEIVNIDFENQHVDRMGYAEVSQSQMFGQSSNMHNTASPGYKASGQSFSQAPAQTSMFTTDSQQTPQMSSATKGADIDDAQLEQKVFQYLNDAFFGKPNAPPNPAISQSLQAVVDEHLMGQIFQNKGYPVGQNNMTTEFLKRAQDHNNQTISNPERMQMNTSGNTTGFAPQQQMLQQQQQQMMMMPQTEQQHYQANPQPNPSTADIDHIKLTTATLGQELREMRSQLQDMQLHGSEKDAEIIRLNMHLADEKKKVQEIFRTNKSSAGGMSSAKSLHTVGRSDRHGSPGSKPDAPEPTSLKLGQLQEENEQLFSENKQLKKKLDSQKKQHSTENKGFKKEIKELQGRLQNVPDQGSFKAEKQQLIEELESKFKQKYNKAKVQMQESSQQLNDQFQVEREALLKDNAAWQAQVTELQGEVQKALKIHKANETLKQKYEQLKADAAEQQNDKTLLEQTVESQTEQISELQKQLINQESENEKLEQINRLQFQKSEMQRSQKELGTKVCENCITNYQKVEEGQLQLAEAQRKADRLENQLNNQRANEHDSTDDVQVWKSKLNAEMAKNEALEAQISDYQMKEQNLEGRLQMQETQLIELQQQHQNDSGNAAAQKSTADHKDRRINELTGELNQLRKKQQTQQQQDTQKDQQLSELRRTVEQLQQDIQEQEANFQQQYQELQNSQSQEAAQTPRQPEGEEDNNEAFAATCEALEAAEQEVERLKQELIEKEKVIDQVSKKMEADIMKTLGVQMQAQQHEADLAKLKKENANLKTQIAEHQATLEALAGGNKKKLKEMQDAKKKEEKEEKERQKQEAKDKKKKK